MMSAVLLAALLLQQHVPPATQVGGPPPSAEAVVSDTGVLRHLNGRVPPVANAVRAPHAPRIDGRADDPVWALAWPLQHFVQRQPLDGQPATESTTVRLAYDDDAVYAFARMYDAEPARIASRLARRDGDARSDMFEVDLDSYHDQRTAFGFSVTPLGVKGDAVYANDVWSGDDSWNAVWDVATQRDSLGWTAEFRIPLSQIRFRNAPTQTWGVNFLRLVHRKAEISAWSWWAQTDEGFASFFGHALGLAGLPQPRRTEVLPYLSARAERLASGGVGNPFNDGSRAVGTLGLDVKYGLTSDLTLNATMNPDFGQVEADPAEVNLTAYETYFGERRPFFVEGADIFGGGNQQYLYSRRIGRAPQREAPAPDGGFADQPTSATILGATKLTGRTAGGWSLGLLEAVTAREHAALSDAAGRRSREVVEPFTNYGVFRAKRDFRSGASTVGFIATTVNRRIDDARLDFLRSAAYAGGVDLSHRFDRNRYRVSASLGYSYIGGDTSAIRLAQTSSARYFDRPDAGHMTFDPSRTSLTGWTGSLGFARLQGDYTYSIAANATSPGFEINDLGYQTRADRIDLSAGGARRWTRPGRVFRSASANASARAQWNFGGDRLATSLSVGASGQFLNYWSLNANIVRTLRTASDALTRGGPLGMVPSDWQLGGGGSSDSRQPLRFTLYAYATRTALAAWSVGGLGSVAWNPRPTVSLALSPSYSVGLSTQQYMAARADATAAATYGRGYLFAEVLQRTLDLTTRIDVTLSPTLSFQLYVQPFVGTGRYRRFKELRAPRTTDYLVFGETPGSTMRDSLDAQGRLVGRTVDPDAAGPRPGWWIGNPDFSARSLRGNAVVRWEYRPGSTLFFVWTNSCSAYRAQPAFDIANDLRHLCQGRADNVFAVKFNYWLSL
jgi:hypothetical protein